MSSIDFKDIDRELEVIDIERKGNLVRFYLGKKEGKWGYTNPNYTYYGETPKWLEPSDIYYGDDWDDAPYEHNAGKVYDEFVKGYIDIALGWDCEILEPRDGALNSNYSKQDFVDKKVPALIVLAKDYIMPDSYYKVDKDGKYRNIFSFFTEIEDDKVVKIYYGDPVGKLLEMSEREDL